MTLSKSVGQKGFNVSGNLRGVFWWKSIPLDATLETTLLFTERVCVLVGSSVLPYPKALGKDYKRYFFDVRLL